MLIINPIGTCTSLIMTNKVLSEEQPTVLTSLLVVWDPEPTDPKRNGYRGASILDALFLGDVRRTEKPSQRPWIAVAKSDIGTRHRTQELAMAACEKRLTTLAKEHLELMSYGEVKTAKLKASYERDAFALKEREREHAMSNPRAAGIKVEILRRFGGHGGRPTEWEISTDDEDAKALIRSMPRIGLIDHSTSEHVGYCGNWIMLPEGTSVALAGEVAACVASLDEDALAAALFRASMEGATCADQCRLVDRAKAWMAKQDTFTPLQLSVDLKIPEWRAIEVVVHVAACGMLIPFDSGLLWCMTDDAKNIEAANVAYNSRKVSP